MGDTVKLLCRKCGLVREDARRDTDYHDTHTIKSLCPECCGGDFCEDMHFDSLGNHIIRDPMLEATQP